MFTPTSWNDELDGLNASPNDFISIDKDSFYSLLLLILALNTKRVFNQLSTLRSSLSLRLNFRVGSPASVAQVLKFPKLKIWPDSMSSSS